MGKSRVSYGSLNMVTTEEKNLNSLHSASVNHMMMVLDFASVNHMAMRSASASHMARDSVLHSVSRILDFVNHYDVMQHYASPPSYTHMVLHSMVSHMVMHSMVSHMVMHSMVSHMVLHSVSYMVHSVPLDI